MCILRIKGRFKNYFLINAHAMTNDSPEEEKEAFYEKLSRVYDNCPKYDIKIVLGDMNAKVGREEIYRPSGSGACMRKRIKWPEANRFCSRKRHGD